MMDWDYWDAILEAMGENIEQNRNSTLKSIDKYQLTLVYADLTDTQKSDLATYRTALLDLPAAYDNPDDCYANFPIKPSWM